MSHTIPGSSIGIAAVVVVSMAARTRMPREFTIRSLGNGKQGLSTVWIRSMIIAGDRRRVVLASNKLKAGLLMAIMV
jgi:hypothetical protein